MFKDKTSKKRIHNNKELSTLDAMHNKIINNYSDKIIQHKNNLNKIKELENTFDYVNNLIINYNNNGIPNENYYNELWNSNIKIREDLIKIKKELKNINDIDEVEYYENTSYILFNYYDMIEKQSNNNSIKNIKFNSKNKSIIDSFNLSLNNNINDNNNNNENDNNINDIKDFYLNNELLDSNKDNKKEINNKTKYKDNYLIFNDDNLIDKSSLVDEYLSITNNNHIRKIEFDNRELCRKCYNVLTCLQQDAIMICNNCGFQEPLLVEQNRPLLKQNTKDTSHFSYKRINHFREWCNQVQGKESTDIPNEVFEKILSEIKKEKITDTRNITYNKMREILKRLRINKYYEHINYIINRINGIPTPQFSPELEDKLCNMFKDIQGPFLKHCPKDRKNFLSYSYVLYKFFQILGLNEYLKFFPLLKSREKLYAQDQIWKKICEELNYNVIPSL